MSAAEYQAGEVVDVVLRGVRVGYSVDDDEVAIEMVGRPNLYLPLDSEAVTIRRHTPAGGAPQPGDLWEDAAGTLYFATDRTRAGIKGVQLCAAAGDSHAYVDWTSVHTGSTGPISLHYRRPEPTPRPPVPAGVEGHQIAGAR